MNNVEEYLAAISRAAKPTLVTLRESIRRELPEATEVLSYGIPVFKLGKPVVGYGAWKTHCGFYALSGVVLEGFSEELKGYSISKSTIRVPFGSSLPRELIARIIQARIIEIAARGS